MSKIRDIIYSHYGKLHSAGVIHGDISRRHILLDTTSTSDIRLIDFGHSRFKEEAVSAVKWEDDCAREMKNVKDMFWDNSA